jgi:biopolymer transport protein ExbB
LFGQQRGALLYIVLIGGNMFLTNQLRALAVALFIAAAPAAFIAPSVALAQAPAAAPASTATPAAPAAAPAAMADTGEKEVVNNPYGIDAMWKNGDFITKTVVIILVIMSMGSWYIMVTKFFEQFKLNSQAREADKNFWNASSVQAGTEELKQDSPFRFISGSALQATERHEGLRGGIDLNEWVTMSIQRAQENIGNRLQDGLAFLATVGSTAPFVGLFGTVWGIYHALTAIGIAGQASIDKVAGPVGEALIMTAFGLAVAVPAVLGYNFLVRRNKAAMERVRAFGTDLHSVILGAGARRV